MGEKIFYKLWGAGLPRWSQERLIEKPDWTAMVWVAGNEVELTEEIEGLKARLASLGDLDEGLIEDKVKAWLEEMEEKSVDSRPPAVEARLPDISLGVVGWNGTQVITLSFNLVVILRREGGWGRLTRGDGWERRVGKQMSGDEVVLLEREQGLKVGGVELEEMTDKAKADEREQEDFGLDQPHKQQVGVVVELGEERPKSVGERIWKREGKIKLKGWTLNEEIRKRRRMVVLGLGGVVVLFVGGLLWGGWRMRQESRETWRQEVIRPIEERLTQAVELSSVNRVQGRNMVRVAALEVESKLAEVSDKGYQQEELVELLAKTQEVYRQVGGEVRVQPELYLDFSLLRENFSGGKMAYGEDEVLVLDITNQTVMSVGVDDKQAEVVAGGEKLGGAKLIATNEDGGMVWGSLGVGLLRGSGVEVVVETDEIWQEIVAMGGYGANVYLMDRGLSEIWRYRPGEEGWNRQRWLAPGVAPDFSKVVDIEIDGDIWILDENGMVRQYSRGVSSGFGLVGWEEELAAGSLGIDEERVLVWVKGENRIVQFNRQGEFEKQYMWEELGWVGDMVLVEGRVLLLSGSKIYEFVAE